MEQSGEELVLELKEMGARRLVRWLAAPVQSGFYLSTSDMQRIGAQIGVRIAPFGRANGLEQFLRGAALDGNLKPALGLIREEMAAHLEAYRSLDLPALDGWVARASATLDAWAAIEEAFQDDEPA